MTESVTATRPIRLVYFAWVRERIGCAEETLSPPAEARTDPRSRALAEDAGRRL